MTIEEKYQLLCATPSDINEHLPTLRKYATGCESIVEVGVRAIVSTWVFLAAKPKQLLSVDITHPKEYGGDLFEVYDRADEQGVNFGFVERSSLEIELPEHDLLFIDTLHTYAQLSAELEKHHSKVKKYIAMHDTNLAGDPDNMKGAVNDFLVKHPEWAIKEYFDNCNGLTILHRV